MAGLALKGILYGVDKIPDTWFDKIPYYQSQEAKQAKKNKSQSKKDRHRRHASADDKYRDDRRRGDRRRRSYEDDESDDESDRDDRRRGRHRENYDERSRTAGAGNGHFAQPRPYRANDFPVHSVPPPVSHSPAARGFVNGRAPPPIDTRVPPQGAYQYEERTGSSGPVPGYVPYADIYQSRVQSNSPYGSRFDQGGASRRGSAQVNAGTPTTSTHQPLYHEPRGHDYNAKGGSRYTDSYDSDDTHHRRRQHRHESRAQSQGGYRVDSRDGHRYRSSKYD